MVCFFGKRGLVDHIAPDKNKASLFQMINFCPDKIAAFSFKQIIDFIVIIVNVYVWHRKFKVPHDPADVQPFYRFLKKYILHSAPYIESKYHMKNSKMDNIV